MCEVAIPNKEIFFVYSKEILSHLDNTIPRSIAVTIQEAIYMTDIDLLQNALETLLLHISKNFAPYTPGTWCNLSPSSRNAVIETFWHRLVLGMCVLIF